MSPARTRSAALAVTPDAKPILLEVIDVALSPIPAGELCKIPALGRKLKLAQVKDLLNDEVAAGRIFLWTTAKSKGYWVRDEATVARDRLLQLAGSEALPAKELEQRVAKEAPCIAPKIVKQARSQLEAGKRLRKEAGVIVDVERPQPYLESEITNLLKRFGIEPGAERIRAFLRNDAPQAIAPTLDSAVEDIADKMLAATERLAFSPGASVTFYRLRQDLIMAAVPKDIFDRAALLLQQSRRALLNVHDHAASLPREEQERLVTDGRGTYYVSIVVR